MATVKGSRPRAVVDTPRPNQALVTLADRVGQKMENNPNFPNAGPLLDELSAATTVFKAALASKATQKGVAEALTAARRGVIDVLFHVKDHVNGVAEKVPADQANAIIESSGLRARKVVVREKPPLEIKYGGLSGTVLLVALAAAKNAAYFFEYSSDEQHWTACPMVMKANTTATGLTVGTTYAFRVRAQTNKGLRDWSDVVTFVVR